MKPKTTELLVDSAFFAIATALGAILFAAVATVLEYLTLPVSYGLISGFAIGFTVIVLTYVIAYWPVVQRAAQIELTRSPIIPQMAQQMRRGLKVAKRVPVSIGISALVLAVLVLPSVAILNIAALSIGAPPLTLRELPAAIGIGIGTIFYLYAVKFYWSVLCVLSGGGIVKTGTGHLSDCGHPTGGNPTSEPFVSIHLPLFNEQNVARRLLTACTTMDYENYEVIVVDDSTDRTTEILEPWADHPRVKIIHRKDRTGFKGGALQTALERTDPRAKFIVVFDADFIPPPDIITDFLTYFYGSDGSCQEYIDDRIAAVQGYQRHMLNVEENWITRGIRAEYCGSYIIERPAQQLLGSMRMIAGSVFMIRADVLRKHGWSTSITEDWELTIRLYLDGYNVIYSPFIWAPAECVAGFRQLVRQRMRWAEGHTYNVKRYFRKVLTSPRISLREKVEFLYYALYYLQALLFMVGTFAWILSEFVLHAHLPYWTELVGWTLVFSNLFSLAIMNLSGLFLERGARRPWSGVMSVVGLSTLLVPFHGYAALKGLLEEEEGGWHRTDKSGRITGIVDLLRLSRPLSVLQPPGMAASPARMEGCSEAIARRPRERKLKRAAHSSLRAQAQICDGAQPLWNGFETRSSKSKQKDDEDPLMRTLIDRSSKAHPFKVMLSAAALVLSLFPMLTTIPTILVQTLASRGDMALVKVFSPGAIPAIVVILCALLVLIAFLLVVGGLSELWRWIVPSFRPREVAQTGD